MKVNTHREFKKNLKKIKSNIESNPRIESTKIDFFNGGDELVIKIESPVDTRIVVSKKDSEEICRVSYLFGYTIIGNKSVEIDCLDFELIINTIFKYLNKD